MHLVQHYALSGDSTPPAEIEGRTFPTPSLVEDDDGIRMLLLGDQGDKGVSIPVRVWMQAHTDGAAALIIGRCWMLTEVFIEHRTEHHASGSYLAPERWNGPEDDIPTSYRQMLAWATEAAQEGAQQTEDRKGTFVHMHTHSEYSALDGMSTMKEIVETVVKDGNTAVAVADHGSCAGHPDLQTAAREAGIKPIFGIEANFVNDRHKRGIKADVAKKMRDAGQEVPEEDTARAVQFDYMHLCLWAMTNEGLRNLWAASTEANREGFVARRPRMDWDTLERHNAGVMASTGCLRGPISVPLRAGDEMTARANLARLMEIFPDRLYVEIHTNQLPDQKQVNEQLVALAREFGLPLMAAVDSHYAVKEDAESHAVWIANQTQSDLTDDNDLFAGQQDYHLLTEGEVREALAYLGPQVVDEAVENTVRAAERCNAEVVGETKTPIYSKVGANGDTSDEARIQRDVERLVDLCMKAWHKTVGKSRPQEEYVQRFDREMRLLIAKGFCGYFLMVADYCLACKEGRIGGSVIMVGPGRGSGGGSLVGWLSGITDIDPVESDLLFERFLTEGRVALPDFDVDFPASKRTPLTNYVVEKYGADYVMRVGTITRLKAKGIVKDMGKVFKNTLDIHWPDLDAVSKIIEEAEADKAGLGISWEDLWDQFEEDLAPYRAKYPLLFHHADKLVGRVKTYGRHAAGVVIATDEPLTGRIPMRMVGEEEKGTQELVAEFDLEALEGLGLVKFDLLTLRTLDTIQMAVDSVRERYGTQVDVYSWKDSEEYADPYVWEELSSGHTLGVFQIETRSGTKMTKRFQPQNLHELADVITLVRPGPMRSGLTETYLRRRAGLEPVTYADPRLEAVLSRTYGCLLYQEDIMAACMVLAGYDSNEADAVRKILGKKQVEKVAKAGEKFVAAAVERGMAREGAEDLWAQMAEFAKYSFNRAHAYGYAVLGYWTAWLKFNFSIDMLYALLSTVDDDKRPGFVHEARRMGFRVLPPDVNVSGRSFGIDGISLRYGFEAVKGIGLTAVNAITYGQPYVSFDDFMQRRGAAANAGIVKIMIPVGAFDSLGEDRKALERRIEFETSEADRCVFKDERALGPGGLPCTFDWANEPDPPMIRKRVDGRMQLVVKEPPKRCTKACRNFTAPTLDLSALQPITPEEIREREKQFLGIYLSSTPFDSIPAEMLENEFASGEDIESGPHGEYVAAVVTTRIKQIKTRTGKDMAFVTMLAQNSEIDVTVFTDQWLRFGPDLRQPDRLALVYLSKNDRGISLTDFSPL